jgi:hypothetical protein
VSAVDLPPGIGLVGTPLATFEAPVRSRRIAMGAVIIVGALLVLTWYFVSKHWWRWHASTQAVLPVAFLMFVLLAWAVRSARLSVTRDGIRWGWTSLSFTQPRAAIVSAHVYADGVALEAKRGSKWFLSARDWARFEQLVRQLKRAELPTVEYEGNAPLRQRMQSYGRFLDGLVVSSVIAAFAVCVWAS